MDIEQHRIKLAKLWDRDHYHRKIEWLSLETDIRQVLEDYRSGDVSSEIALDLVDQYVGAYTRRGTVLPESTVLESE